MYICLYVSLSIYIYIYRERERDIYSLGPPFVTSRVKRGQTTPETNIPISSYMCIYIYIYIYRERERDR